jgi:hypothetical protein
MQAERESRSKCGRAQADRARRARTRLRVTPLPGDVAELMEALCELTHGFEVVRSAISGIGEHGVRLFVDPLYDPIRGDPVHGLHQRPVPLGRLYALRRDTEELLAQLKVVVNATDKAIHQRVPFVHARVAAPTLMKA